MELKKNGGPCLGLQLLRTGVARAQETLDEINIVFVLFLFCFVLVCSPLYFSFGGVSAFSPDSEAI